MPAWVPRTSSVTYYKLQALAVPLGLAKGWAEMDQAVSIGLAGTVSALRPARAVTPGATGLDGTAGVPVNTAGGRYYSRASKRLTLQAVAR